MLMDNKNGLFGQGEVNSLNDVENNFERADLERDVFDREQTQNEDIESTENGASKGTIQRIGGASLAISEKQKVQNGVEAARKAAENDDINQLESVDDGKLPSEWVTSIKGAEEKYKTDLYELANEMYKYGASYMNKTYGRSIGNGQTPGNSLEKGEKAA